MNCLRKIKTSTVFLFLLVIFLCNNNLQAAIQFLDMQTFSWQSFENKEKMLVQIGASKGSELANKGWYTVMLKNFSANTKYVFNVLEKDDSVPENIIVTPHLILDAPKRMLNVSANNNIVVIETRKILPSTTTILIKIYNTAKIDRQIYIKKTQETIIENTTTLVNKAIQKKVFPNDNRIILDWVDINENSFDVISID